MRICTICVVLLSVPLWCAGCSREIIVEGLSANNPALAEAPVGQPPVPPESLTITPTGMAPTASPAIAPDPILPKMGEVYESRRLPAGVEVEPADKPREHETPPEGLYQPESEGEE